MKKSKKKKNLAVLDDNYEVVPGWEKSSDITYRETKQSKSIHDKTQDLKNQFLTKEAYDEYLRLREDYEGEGLLRSLSDSDPNVIRYVRLEKEKQEDAEIKRAKEQFQDKPLVYVKTRISDEDQPYIDDFIEDEEDIDEVLEELEDDEEDYIEVEPLEYIRTNLSSRTEITGDDLRDNILGRHNYMADNIQYRTTSISNFKKTTNIREEYLIVGKTDITNKKYEFKRLSAHKTPVTIAPNKVVPRLYLKKDEGIE